MECKDFRERIDDYIKLASKMDIWKRIEFRVHMDVCVECRKKYIEAREQKRVDKRGF